MQKSVIDELITKNELIKKFKLTSIINTSNMNVFDNTCKIRTVNSPEEIIYRFYQVRKEHFIKRKKHIITKLSNELVLIESKIKFINYIINEKIVVFNKKKDFIISQIEKVGDLVKIDNSWDYLLELKLWTFTDERIRDLNELCSKLTTELNILKKKTISEIWTSELNNIINIK